MLFVPTSRAALNASPNASHGRTSALLSVGRLVGAAVGAGLAGIAIAGTLTATTVHHTLLLGALVCLVVGIPASMYLLGGGGSSAGCPELGPELARTARRTAWTGRSGPSRGCRTRPCRTSARTGCGWSHRTPTGSHRRRTPSRGPSCRPSRHGSRGPAAGPGPPGSRPRAERCRRAPSGSKHTESRPCSATSSRWWVASRAVRIAMVVAHQHRAQRLAQCDRLRELARAELRLIARAQSLFVQPPRQLCGRVRPVLAGFDVKGVDEVDDELKVVWWR